MRTDTSRERPNLRAGHDVVSPDPSDLIIRNQRYLPWNEIVLGIFAAVFIVVMCGLPVVETFTTINFVFAAGVVGLLALIVFEGILPRLGAVRELKLGIRIETTPIVKRLPIQAVQRVRFAADPDEDYADRESATRLYQATVEIGSGRPIRLIVTHADADRLRQWALAKGIAVSERDR